MTGAQSANTPSDDWSLRRPEALPEPLPHDPFPLFVAWFEQATRGTAAACLPNPNAMSLATIDADGRPSNRIVLCKGIDAGLGSIAFYTNYEGRKGQALRSNPRCAVCFHWDPVDLQVRMEGAAQRTTGAESDAYFASRPWLSQIGAWSSDQSRTVESREALEARITAMLERFGLDPANPPARDARVEIPRPAHWGGFRIVADRVELWVGAKGRLHDRAVWQRTIASGDSGWAGIEPWRGTRLQP